MAAREPDPVLLPVDEATAVYADHYDVWVSPRGITLDLYVGGPVDPDEGLRVASPVARARLAPTMVFPMIQRLSAAIGEHLGEDLL